jgi:hypothetical protein
MARIRLDRVRNPKGMSTKVPAIDTVGYKITDSYNITKSNNCIVSPVDNPVIHGTGKGELIQGNPR